MHKVVVVEDTNNINISKKISKVDVLTPVINKIVIKNK